MKVFCPYCGGIKESGKPCKCSPKPKRKQTRQDLTRKEREPWRADYNTQAYRKARQEVIQRSNGRCVDCGVVCAEKINGVWKTQRLGGEVDHEGMLRRGATSDPSGLALRCKSCHAKADRVRRKSFYSRP